ncbi:MAG TPA: glycosyltransferase family 4 protein [Rhodocyclaceae bacterium]|nr:glycosyltransferase family 4 protein [Rhodocyclaceae bacterium]
MVAEAGYMLAVGLAFGAAWGVTRTCCRPDSLLHFVDLPNERSLHVRPTPRTGGVGVMAGVLLGGGLALLAGHGSMGLVLALAGAVLLAVVGLADDRLDLSARVRLLVHLGVAAGFVVISDAGGGVEAWRVLPLVLGLVWMTNLYNFMDGSDGLAGGMAVWGFVAYAVAAGGHGDGTLAAVCASIAAAAAGFLCFNFPPARIFMGDSGSVPLGFLAGALGCVGVMGNRWPAWFPVLVFSPFIVDASVTLARRALRGERVWQAHRTHYYQRLVQMGYGHRGVAVRAYGLMAACGGSALLVMDRGVALQCFVITMWTFVYMVVGFRIDRAWRRSG